MSLEKFVIIEVLDVGASGTTPNRRKKASWSGSIGVLERSKNRERLHGNTGEPNFSARDMVNSGKPYPKEMEGNAHWAYPP
jgi:hypothetical protein